MTDAVQIVAKAIYGAWSREPDPRRVDYRFERLKPAVREQFETEAKAALRVCEDLFRAGEYA